MDIAQCGGLSPPTCHQPPLISLSAVRVRVSFLRDIPARYHFCSLVICYLSFPKSLQLDSSFLGDKLSTLMRSSREDFSLGDKLVIREAGILLCCLGLGVFLHDRLQCLVVFLSGSEHLQKVSRTCVGPPMSDDSCYLSFRHRSDHDDNNLGSGVQCGEI